MASVSKYVGEPPARLTQIEKRVRGITGAVFVLAGIYYCLTHVYGISLMAW